MKKNKTNATQLISALNDKGATCVVPNGNSMWPFIKNHKQTVVIEKLKGDLELLDVILFKREDGSLVLHRLIDFKDNLLTVCGDSQLMPERIKTDSVIGIMTGFYKGKKLVSSRNPKYLKKVRRWYKRKNYRKFRIKIYFLVQRIFNKFKREKEDV